MPCGGIVVCCAAPDWLGPGDNAARPSKPFKPSRRLIFTSLILPADHQNRKRPGHRRALRRAASTRWRRGCRTALLAHREDVVGFGVERNRSRAIHGVKILLDFEACRALLL